ncbi:MAG: hypothetical protein JW874_03765 [Spirochaetales bacterium]|nr:hypothetical protein [Spirochaetales bacterium]
MKKLTVLLVLIAACAVSLCADEVLDKADKYFDSEQYEQGYKFVESELKPGLSKQKQAELYWRLARFALYIGGDMEDAGAGRKELIDIFVKGQELAEKAIELSPGADAYYWRSSNVGREGEIKGVLNSLAKAKPMRDDLITVLSFDKNYADAFYVLGRLFFLLPGGISFGDKDKAVSYARRSVALYKEKELKVSFYKSLAEILWKRNWDAAKRNKNIPKMEKDLAKAGDEFERMAVYEYSLGLNFTPPYASKKIGQMSDREEAQAIIDWLKAEYRKVAKPDNGQIGDMKEVDEMIAEWK